MGGFAQLPTELIGKISNSALLVYTIMRDRAERDPVAGVWLLRYKVATIAAACNVSERCCRDCIAELEQCGLLGHDRTGRSSIYVIMAPERWSAPRPAKNGRITYSISQKGVAVK